MTECWAMKLIFDSSEILAVRRKCNETHSRHAEKRYHAFLSETPGIRAMNAVIVATEPRGTL